MEPGAIFLLVVVVILIAMFVARPFWGKRRILTVSTEEHETSSLLAERDRLLTALQELDFDHTLGKIPSEDYPGMRAGLLQNASETLRRLDVLQPQSAGAGSDAESRVEAVIAARRADASGEKPAPAVLADEDLEELVAARRAERKEKAAGFCPQCGKPVVRSDRFCPHCGKSIQ
jgi:NADH pyrophosphatase NudC (nudix superfamily)